MFANVFACLVHESQPCIIDLIRNLRCCDPDSTIVLYDGSARGEVLRDFPFDRYGVLIHPSPRPMKWGRLHEFAICCMQYCLSSFRFDSITIVDSDQLLLQEGYSEFLRDRIGRDHSIGMFVTDPRLQGPDTSIGPCQSAFTEFELWRPFLQTMPDGEEHFVHWTFWPGTVFIENAVRDLVDRFQRDELLKSIMERTQMWATEEVIFPTITALLGYGLGQNPCDNRYLRYGASFDPSDVISAPINRCFWIHPVARQYGDPVRSAIRQVTGHFAGVNPEPVATPRQVDSLTTSVLQNIESIDGWLSAKEAGLLAKSCRDVLRDIDGEWNLVEVGSYHGRSTTAITTTIRNCGADRQLFAVDPHEGEVGSLDSRVIRLPSSAANFAHNLRIRGLHRHVEPVPCRTQDLQWQLPVGFLFIDGLHDYPSVAHDFFVFDPWLVLGGIAAFHDYSASYPGVVTFVNEVINNDAYRILDQSDTLIVCQKRKITSADLQRRCQLRRNYAGITTSYSCPLISCILPTCDRAAFLQKSIQCYLEQDYNNRELVVVDDGCQPLHWSLPESETVTYLRLDGHHSIGAKRNIGCEVARGDYIAHWDDDDWYAPWRLSTQLSELLRSGADVSGASTMTYQDIQNDQWWRYENPDRGLHWVHGATLFYRKTYWEEHRFEDISIGEDSLFVRHCARSKLLKLNESSFYVGSIHSGNSSYKNTKEPCWRGPLASCF
jgi:Glycosyl transferase family 2/Methyltransferase domain